MVDCKRFDTTVMKKDKDATKRRVSRRQGLYDGHGCNGLSDWFFVVEGGGPHDKKLLTDADATDGRTCSSHDKKVLTDADVTDCRTGSSSWKAEDHMIRSY